MGAGWYPHLLCSDLAGAAQGTTPWYTKYLTLTSCMIMHVGMHATDCNIYYSALSEILLKYHPKGLVPLHHPPDTVDTGILSMFVPANSRPHSLEVSRPALDAPAAAVRLPMFIMLSMSAKLGLGGWQTTTCTT